MSDPTVVNPTAAWSSFASVLLLVAFASPSRGQSCDALALPAEIKSVLQKDFAGWKLVTPEMFDGDDDRKDWNDCCENECPGAINGHFTGRKIEYAVNLVSVRGKSRQQQFVLFKSTQRGFRKVVLIPPSRGLPLSVLRKLPAGEYRSAETDELVKLRFDGIGVHRIAAGAGAFYWDGKRFRFLITSV